MKTILACSLALLALAACDDVQPYSHATQKCRDLRLTVGSAEYNDCVSQMQSQEGNIAGSKNLH